MVCSHLKELYQLCEQNQLKLSSTDLIRIVCKQCEKEDTCPSGLVETVSIQKPASDRTDSPVKSGQSATD